MIRWLIWVGVIVAAYCSAPLLYDPWAMLSWVLIGYLLALFEPPAITRVLDQFAGKKVGPKAISEDRK